MKRMSVVELRKELADILNRAEYLGERTVIHRRDNDAAAIISIEDLHLLERLIREEEDRVDIAAARIAQKDADHIPYEDFRAELRMTNESGTRAVSDRDRRSRPASTRKNGKERA